MASQNWYENPARDISSSYQIASRAPSTYAGLHRRPWITCCTVMRIITLLFTALVDLQENSQRLRAMIVLDNLFCATQDVAIDSLAVSTLRVDERSRFRSGPGVRGGGNPDDSVSAQPQQQPAVR